MFLRRSTHSFDDISAKLITTFDVIGDRDSERAFERGECVCERENERERERERVFALMCLYVSESERE